MCQSIDLPQQAAHRPLHRWLDALAAAVRRARRSLAAARHLADSRRRFDALDDAALRDLGMARSEFDSYWVEATGAVPRTRLRTRLGVEPQS
ncbi:MAG: hypothetical protein AVDCRST_MAG51-2579 [uncultured Ramlibacter sp.]|uniref:DUF1127 domain-containing protein n=1 Tax=uncultured Ramlibacter sp. TaxID=260755 RepID=A0A6J4Q0P0_9BURK|nr:MAG: hypothetical protein AVDCRST_MAG51-2579 [uncultured Ramlibacter sp.]